MSPGIGWPMSGEHDGDGGGPASPPEHADLSNDVSRRADSEQYLDTVLRRGGHLDAG